MRILPILIFFWHSPVFALKPGRKLLTLPDALNIASAVTMIQSRKPIIQRSSAESRSGSQKERPADFLLAARPVYGTLKV
jgi:hypothetical protein